MVGKAGFEPTIIVFQDYCFTDVTVRVCKLEKDENEFYWKNKSKGKKQLECKDCTKKMVANHYSNNKEYYGTKTRFHKKSKRDWFNEYKTTLKCNVCGENHPAVLDFHHNDPNQKEGEVTTIVSRNWSLDRIKEEINKCTVLCSNCHRKLHWGEKNNN